MSYPISVVPFHGDSIITLDAEGNHYVAISPISDALGIAAFKQREKLKNDERWQHKLLPCQTSGGVQETFCIPLKKLNGWLFSINPNKVRSDLKEKVIQYQEECFEVLFRYWQGEAVSRQAKPQTPYDLIDTQKLKSLQSQSKALAWDYLNSLGIEQPAIEATIKPANQPRSSYRHQPYDLGKLAASLRPLAREYDKHHFWVHVHELNTVVKYQRKATLNKLIDANLLFTDKDNRYTRKVNMHVARHYFKGTRKRVYVLSWKLLDQESQA